MLTTEEAAALLSVSPRTFASMIRQSGEDGFCGVGCVCDLRQPGRGEWCFDPARSLGLWKSGPSTLVIGRRNRQAKPAGNGRLHGTALQRRDSRSA